MEDFLSVIKNQFTDRLKLYKKFIIINLIIKLIQVFDLISSSNYLYFPFNIDWQFLANFKSTLKLSIN